MITREPYLSPNSPVSDSDWFRRDDVRWQFDAPAKGMAVFEVTQRNAQARWPL